MLCQGEQKKKLYTNANESSDMRIVLPNSFSFKKVLSGKQGKFHCNYFKEDYNRDSLSLHIKSLDKKKHMKVSGATYNSQLKYLTS